MDTEPLAGLITPGRRDRGWLAQRRSPTWGIIIPMAVVNDMLYQLAGSAVDETEIAEELRVDPPTARRCLERLLALGVVEGPVRIEGSNMWSPIDSEEFPDLVARAKAAGVDVRQSIADFAGAAG